MTKSVFSFITLYGLSFSLWGFIGLCRFFQENFRRADFARWIVSSGVVAALLVALVPAQHPSGVFTETLISIAGIGLVGGFGVSRTFKISIPPGVTTISLGLGLLLFAASAISSAAHWEVFSGFSLPAAAIFALSFLSGGMGAALAPTKTLSPSDAHPSPSGVITPNDVAVLIPAHNEERTIGACLKAITAIMPCENVYVASDGSTDDTVRLVRQWGCHVTELHPGRGKAGALTELLRRFEICTRYKAAMILDADSQVDPHYLQHALPMFNDPAVVAVAGHAFPHWKHHRAPRWAMFFVGYRVRLYKVTQAFLRYGQTWRYTNVSFIIPGFASMYRTRVLPQIDITAEGLVIEDFNMTFEVHHKKLGKIAYTPRARCMCQDPTNLRDYVRQVKRWDLGLWQTVRRHGLWAGAFWFSLSVFLLEIFLQSAIFLTIPLLLAWFMTAPGEPLLLWLPFQTVVELQLADVVVGVIVADYLLTVIVALLEKKPMLLLYGLGFLIPRWIDALLFLATLPLAFVVKSDGRWTSPARS